MPQYTRQIDGYLPLFCEICRDVTVFESREVREILPSPTEGARSVLYCHEAECEGCGIRCPVEFEPLGMRPDKTIPEDPAARAREVFGNDHHVTNRIELEKNLEAGLLADEQRDALPWLVYQAVAMDAQIPCWMPGQESKTWFRACLLVFAALCLFVTVAGITPNVYRLPWLPPIFGLATFVWWLDLWTDRSSISRAQRRMDELATSWLARGLAPLRPTGLTLATLHQQVTQLGWPYPRVNQTEILRRIEGMDVARIEPGTDDEINRLLDSVPRMGATGSDIQGSAEAEEP